MLIHCAKIHLDRCVYQNKSFKKRNTGLTGALIAAEANFSVLVILLKKEKERLQAICSYLNHEVVSSKECLYQVNSCTS